MFLMSSLSKWERKQRSQKCRNPVHSHCDKKEGFMTAKDIERDMKASVGGASFISPGELAKYLGQKNTSRVRKKYMNDAFKIEGTKKYFIPEVAKAVYYSGEW